MNKSCLRSRAALLRVADTTFSLLLASPLVVCYWRGCWQLMDTVLFPNNFDASVYASLFIGIVPELVFCFTQFQLEEHFSYKTRPTLHVIVSRLYTTIFSFSCVNHWRGVWELWKLYTGYSWQSGAISTILGLFLLIISRGVKNILAPPFILLPDRPKDYFVMPTLYQAQKSTLWSRLLDAFFTVLVTNSLVVFVWRGAWCLLDHFLYPKHDAASAIGSLVIGMCLSVPAFLIQSITPLCSRCIRHTSLKIILEDIYNIFCFIVTVNIWRGVWNTLNVFFLPDRPDLSNLLTAVLGQLILTLFYCSNSILVRGARMDGALPGVQGLIFDVNYFSFFFGLRRKSAKLRSNFWATKAKIDETRTSKSDRDFKKFNGGIYVAGGNTNKVDIDDEMSGEETTRFDNKNENDVQQLGSSADVSQKKSSEDENITIHESCTKFSAESGSDDPSSESNDGTTRFGPENSDQVAFSAKNNAPINTSTNEESNTRFGSSSSSEDNSLPKKVIVRSSGHISSVSDMDAETVGVHKKTLPNSSISKCSLNDELSASDSTNDLEETKL